MNGKTFNTGGAPPAESKTFREGKDPTRTARERKKDSGKKENGFDKTDSGKTARETKQQDSGKTAREKAPDGTLSRRQRKKKSKKGVGGADDFNFSKRQSKNFSTDGTSAGRSERQKKSSNNNNNDLLLEKEARTAEGSDWQSSRREKQQQQHRSDAGHRSEETLIEPKFEKEKAAETPAKDPICSETFGYGPDFLDSWLNNPETIELKIEPPKKVPVLKVSKTLVIYDVPKELSPQIEIGDILYKFNDSILTSREEYIRQLSHSMKVPDFQVLTFTIFRPIRSLPIPDKELSNTFAKLQQQQGFEILPAHFDYLTVFLTIAPKTQLGLTIKGYNGKVYISRIEKSLNSIAYKCLLVGDAILAIEDQAMSGVKDTDNMLCTTFVKKKFVRLIIERAKTPAGLRTVKLALSVERTFELNPRMTEDVMEICERQITFMEKYPELKPNTKIVKKVQPKPSTSHLHVNPESKEQTIGTDVNNLILLAPTPPVPSVPPGTIGFYNPLESYNNPPSKRAIKKKSKPIQQQ